MRDLTRANNKRPGWKRLSDAGYRVFTPMTWKIRHSSVGKATRQLCPVIHDLLFVESTREELDPFVEREPMIQYRYVKGGAYREAMEVKRRRDGTFHTGNLRLSQDHLLSSGRNHTDDDRQGNQDNRRGTQRYVRKTAIG